MLGQDFCFIRVNGLISGGFLFSVSLKCSSHLAFSRSLSIARRLPCLFLIRELQLNFPCWFSAVACSAAQTGSFKWFLLTSLKPFHSSVDVDVFFPQLPSMSPGYLLSVFPFPSSYVFFSHFVYSFITSFHFLPTLHSPASYKPSFASSSPSFNALTSNRVIVLTDHFAVVLNLFQKSPSMPSKVVIPPTTKLLTLQKSPDLSPLSFITPHPCLSISLS